MVDHNPKPRACKAAERQADTDKTIDLYQSDQLVPRPEHDVTQSPAGTEAHAGPDIMRTVEVAIGQRARRLMPYVILVLCLAGISMAWQYRESLAHPFASSFALLLGVKIILTLSVLAHFITTIALISTGKMKARHSPFIHLSVFCQVILIVFLAKAMFYIAW
jgi:hypothetical protein